MNPLENDHNVYLLGAGFSVPGGMPVIADFMFALRDAQEWLSSQGRAREAQAIERVLTFRLSATPAAYRVELDLENIEELFSFASIAEERLSDDIRIAIAATLDYRRAVSPRRTLDFSVNGRGFPRPTNWAWRVRSAGDGSGLCSADQVQFYTYAMLGGFSSTGPKGKNTFITLNYDLLLEEALTALEVSFSYGSPMHLPLSAERKLLVDVSEHPLILKLHGSVNWAAWPSRPDLISVLNSYADVVHHNLSPILIPPTWRKSVPALFSDIWKRARDQIQLASRLIIIGFSIPETDQDIKYLLAAGLRENISLREIVFVNPDAQALEGRLTRFFGILNKRPRVRLVALRTEQFLQPGMDGGIESVGRPIHGSLQNVLLANQ